MRLVCPAYGLAAWLVDCRALSDYFLAVTLLCYVFVVIANFVVAVLNCVLLPQRRLCKIY